MSRTAITKVVDRERLIPRADPYWMKVRKGCYLGYRKMTSSSAGTWQARARDERSGKQHYRPLGAFDDLPDNKRFDAAREAADEWFEHLGRGGTPVKATVRTACSDYVKYQRAVKGQAPADDIEARFERWVYPNAEFADTELSKLSPLQVESWRLGLARRIPRYGKTTLNLPPRSDSSINRDMTSLRAALNHAKANGLVTTDHAWKIKLAPIENAGSRRNTYMNRQERDRLISSSGADIAVFLKLLAWMPLRPGTVAAAKVRDFNAKLGVLRIPKDKTGKPREIHLPTSTANFIAKLIKERSPDAPMVHRLDGAAWNKDSWKGPVKDAVAAAGLPSEITAYTFRHSVITDMVAGGDDLHMVAELSDTSILMIQKHYGHLNKERARQALQRLRGR